MLERVHKLIKRATVPPQSVIDLLKSTLIGTEGTLYQLLDTETKIHQLNQPHFIYFERNGKAVGNVTICEREVTLNQVQKPTLYLRYFAFGQIFQGGTKQGNSNSGFHTYFKALFETSNFNPVIPKQEQSVYWAFIDPENLRSFNMNKRFGFQTIGQFQTTAFSRSNPKSYPVERLAKSDRAEVLTKINAFYEGYQFFSDVHLFKQDNYFVLREKGEIICGIQANPVHWKIKSLPGFTGKMMLKFAPYIPGIKQVINPENHRFLATEGLFWQPGYANRVRELLEGVLAATHHNSLLIWTDMNSQLLVDLKIKWGIIERIKKNNPVHIVAKFNGYAKKEVDAIKNAPKYLSGFDMT